MDKTNLRNLKVYDKDAGTPQIILQGKWLKKAGFGIGEMVQVLVTDTVIQIIKAGK